MGIRQETFNDYEGFVEKFKPKKTTDDCYTPPKVYEAVLAWVRKRYAIHEDTPIIRPFFPGGDFENAEYPDGCVVVDNPPFSIAAKIVRFFLARNIRFFIFANGLTLFSSLLYKGVGAVISHVSITYENGAKVNTGFLTNMGGNLVEISPELRQAIRSVNGKLARTEVTQRRKLRYPSAIATAAKLGTLASRGVNFSIPFGEAVYIRGCDAIGDLFGGGLLLSERAAAERAAAERAAEAVFELSPRERELQKLIGREAV